MNYYINLIVFWIILFVDAEFDFRTENFQFIGCQRVEDRSTLHGVDRKYFEFTFNTSLSYSQFEVRIYRNYNSTEFEYQLVQCEQKNENNEVVCPLIKGLFYTPISSRRKTLRLKSIVYGKNETGSFVVAKSVSNFSLCLLRKCKNFATPLKLFDFDLTEKQLDYKFGILPSQTKNFNQYLVDVELVNGLSNLTLLTKNLTNTQNNPQYSNGLFTFAKCIDHYNQICVTTRFDYCLDNSSKAWKVVKRCQSFSYSSLLPHLTTQCNVENGITTITVTTTKKFSSFHFVYTLNNDVIKSPNDTITIAENFGHFAVAFCDECKCGKTFNIRCEKLTNPVEPPKSQDNSLVIVLSVAGVFLVLILLISLFLWKRNCKKLPEELSGVYTINPTSCYEYPTFAQSSPHKYFNVATQHEYEYKPDKQENNSLEMK